MKINVTDDFRKCYNLTLNDFYKLKTRRHLFCLVLCSSNKCVCVWVCVWQSRSYDTKPRFIFVLYLHCKLNCHKKLKHVYGPVFRIHTSYTVNWSTISNPLHLLPLSTFLTKERFPKGGIYNQSNSNETRKVLLWLRSLFYQAYILSSESYNMTWEMTWIFFQM